MGRSPCCCHDTGVKKGPWTEEEDRTLVEHIQRHGGHIGSWRNLPKAAGLNRCGKSCRLRWTNYLRPDIKRGNFTGDEEALIIRLHAELGNKWSTIATHLDGRTDNEIKNYWNTHIRKKLLRMGVDPVTHQRLPPEDILGGALASPGLHEVLLSAAASLGGLNTALMQAQALQLLLQAITGRGAASAGSAGLASASSFNSASSSAAADDAILRGVVPSFGHQDHQMMMNLLSSHANYPPRPADDCNGSIFASSAEHGVVQQLMNASAPVSGHGHHAEPPPTAAAALVSASCPRQEVAAAADRPVQGFADLLSEPIEMPAMCSLEDDLFWKDMLESSTLPL
ncbi:hypothetical protein BS78_06G210900 [Paspalum vaginatum]|nr:hypothetical protein BS78_06G210900 [Paspalum vaginatum]